MYAAKAIFLGIVFTDGLLEHVLSKTKRLSNMTIPTTESLKLFALRGGVNNKLQSPNLRLLLLSWNASLNVHSILMFVRSDSAAVRNGGLTEDIRKSA